MTARASNISTIEQVLRQQFEAATALARVLDDEAAAIKDRNADTLTALAPQKLAGLKRLEELESLRIKHTSNGLRASVSEKELWDQVLQIIRVCHRKNQLNGVMLNLRRDHIQRAMDLITNRDVAAITYAPDGSTKSTAGQFSTSVSA